MKCPACKSDVAVGSHFCPGCGHGLETSPSHPTRQRTPTSQGAAALRPLSTEPRRFEPGHVLASRYRVVERLGAGGMGEVYRADDLTLDQPVALKFLPPALSDNEPALARFRSEVRLARQIAHPNVCRVYDIGEVDGHHFISMELVPGEDLQSLLRRIGHVPKDKAAAMAVELCSALAAAHAKGVLHRDLKPANIMLDDRGHVRIMDFGLAAAAGRVGRDDVRSGTPAYMAPEQLSGQEVTERSDIYSLGLVLYQLFTGRVPRSESLSAPSRLVEGLDPAFDEIILRCLEPDPSRRPPSADHVRRAFPTVDPLAIAVARGETPARELVAEAGAFTGLSPAVAWSCLFGVVLSLAGVVWTPQSRLTRLVPLPRSPELLVADARAVLQELGFPTPQRDSTYGFLRDTTYIDYSMELRAPTDWRALLSSGEPSVIRFWYRESPELLVPHRTTEFFASQHDPPHSTPGMVRLELDTFGRLHRLDAVPLNPDDSEETVRRETDWEPLFSAAGLSLESFSPVPPRDLPPTYADERAAWSGVHPRIPTIPLRIESSAFRGRPTSFRVLEPWSEPSAPRFTQAADIVPSPLGRLVHVGLHFLFLVTLAVVAGRNLRLSRGDNKLALRLAGFLFVLVMLQWLLGAHHVSGSAQLEVFFGGLYRAFFTAGLAWLFYIALEPYFRKLWPQSLISWVRLLDGRFRDPRVGRDTLIGCVWGAGFALLYQTTKFAPRWLGGLSPRPDEPRHPAELIALRGVSESLSEVLAVAVNISTHVMYLFIALLLLRFLLRRTWAAVSVHAALYAALYASGGFHPVVITAWIVTWHFLFFRIGWVPILVGTLIVDLLAGYPLTSDLSAWNAYPTLVAIGFCLSLALYGFKVSLGGRPVFRDLLGET